MQRESRPDLAAGLADEQRSDLGDLSQLTESLARYVAPEPSAADTARLIGRLRPLAAERYESEPLPAVATRAGLRPWLRLIAAQVAVMEPGFLWASALLLGIGVAVAFWVKGQMAVPMLIASPVFAAAGVAYLFRPQARSLWELERASPVHPLELLYARLGLVSSVNLAFVAILLAGLWFHEPRLVLWRLALGWLGPVVALCGLALFASVRYGAVAGAALPLVAWAALVTLLSQWAAREGGSLWVQVDRLLPIVAQSNSVVGVSLGALLVGLWLLRTGSRMAVGDLSSWS